jgi:hypothetical protein
MLWNAINAISVIQKQPSFIDFLLERNHQKQRGLSNGSITVSLFILAIGTYYHMINGA